MRGTAGWSFTQSKARPVVRPNVDDESVSSLIAQYAIDSPNSFETRNELAP